MILCNEWQYIDQFPTSWIKSLYASERSEREIFDVFTFLNFHFFHLFCVGSLYVGIHVHEIYFVSTLSWRFVGSCVPTIISYATHFIVWSRKKNKKRNSNTGNTKEYTYEHWRSQLFDIGGGGGKTL